MMDTVDVASIGDLVALIPVLATAYGVVLGMVALCTGWQLFRDRRQPRYRRGVAVPPGAVIERAAGGVR